MASNSFITEPALSGWSFIAGRPKKEWKRILLWGPRSIEIDANDWLFQLRRYPDGLHDIELFTEQEIAETTKETESIIYEVLCSELGDNLVCDTVYDIHIKIVENLNDVQSLHHISTLEDRLLESLAVTLAN